MNETQRIKQSVSNYLKNKNQNILDLFYKMPCNSCITVDDWNEKFSFFPDILLLEQNKFHFCFVLNNKNLIEKAENYIKKNNFLDNFKIFYVEGNKLFELNEKKMILKPEELKFENIEFSKEPRPFKSKTGEFEKNRILGKLGETELMKYFDKTNTKYIDLNFNAPCDLCSNPENWKKFNKLPDGILKEKDNLYFFDAKAKRSRFFKINYRDFKEYSKIQKNFKTDVRIFFLIFDYNRKLKEIFQSNIKVDEINLSESWDRNKVIDLSKNLTQLY